MVFARASLAKYSCPIPTMVGPSVVGLFFTDTFLPQTDSPLPFRLVILVHILDEFSSRSSPAFDPFG